MRLARRSRTWLFEVHPAIGITAAYGTVLVARQAERDEANWRDRVRAALPDLARARPTAVNLRWAVERVEAHLNESDASPDTRSPGGPHPR